MMNKGTSVCNRNNCAVIFVLALLCLVTTPIWAQNPNNNIPPPRSNMDNSNTVVPPLEITWHLIVEEMELGNQSGWQVNIPYVQLNNVTKHWMNYLKDLNYLVRKKRSRQGTYFFAPNLQLPSVNKEQANVYTYFSPYVGGVSLKAFFNINGQFVEGNSAAPSLQQAIDRFLMDFAVGEYAQEVKSVIAAEGMNLMELQIENNQLSIQLRDRAQQIDKHQAILNDLERAYQEDLALQVDNTQVINQKVEAIEFLQSNLGKFGEEVNLDAKDYLANNSTAQQPYPPYQNPKTGQNPAQKPPRTGNRFPDKTNAPSYPPDPGRQQTSAQPKERQKSRLPYPKSNTGWDKSPKPATQSWGNDKTPPTTGQTPYSSPKNQGQQTTAPTRPKTTNNGQKKTTVPKTATTLDLLNAQGKPVNYLTPKERAMIEEINLIRSNPRAYIPYVNKYLSQLNDPNSEIGGLLDIKEETAAARELIGELGKMSPLPLFIPHQGVYQAARNHGLDLQRRGRTGHQGSDGSLPHERIKRAAPEMIGGGESIVAGLKDIRTIIIYLLIDGGVANRGHRENLLADYWTHIGVYQILNKVGSVPYCWVQNFGENPNVLPTTPPIASTKPPVTRPNVPVPNTTPQENYSTKTQPNTTTTTTTTTTTRKPWVRQQAPTTTIPPNANRNKGESAVSSSNNKRKNAQMPRTPAPAPVPAPSKPIPVPPMIPAGAEFLNAQGQFVAYLTAAEKAMIQEINLLRSNPKAYITHVEQYVQQLGNPNSEVGSLLEATSEQRVARELIAELKRTPPMPLLIPHQGMYETAKKHGLVIKQRNQTGHQGMDGSYPHERIKRDVPDMKTGSENIVAGLQNIRTALINLLIDNGIENRGHRKNLLAVNWTHIGVYQIDGEINGVPYCWIQNFGEQKGHVITPTNTTPLPPATNNSRPDPLQQTTNNVGNTIPTPIPNPVPLPTPTPMNNQNTIRTNSEWLFLDESISNPAPMPVPAPNPVPQQPGYTPPPTSATTPRNTRPTVFSNDNNSWGTGGLPASDYSNFNQKPKPSDAPPAKKTYPWLKED